MKSYRYIDGEYEVKIEIKRSIFIATVKGELNAEEADEFVRSIKKKYPDATHNCYAYIGDELGNMTRFSDDGEPSGTAGQPILDVLKKQNIVKSAIVVTRYFGGIKLGAGGLVGAYSQTASDGVASCVISEKVQCRLVRISADYSVHSVIEKHLRKTNCVVDDIVYGQEVESRVFVPCDDADAFVNDINEISAGKAFVEKTDELDYKKF